MQKEETLFCSYNNNYYYHKKNLHWMKLNI